MVVARIRNSKGGHRRIAEVHVRIGIASHVHDVGTVVVVGSCGDPCAAVPVVVAVVKVWELMLWVVVFVFCCILVVCCVVFCDVFCLCFGVLFVLIGCGLFILMLS